MVGATEQSLYLISEIIMVFSRTGRCSDEGGFQSDCSEALRTGGQDVRVDVTPQAEMMVTHKVTTQEVKMEV